MTLLAYYAEVIHSYLVASGSIVAVYWRGCLQVILLFFPKCSSRFSNVFLIVVYPVSSVPVYYVTFEFIGSFSFGDTSMFLIALFPLKCVLMPYLLHMPLMLLQRPCTYVMTMYPFYLLLLLLLLLFLVLLDLFSWKFLHSILSISHGEYLLLVRTSLMCFFSVLSSFDVDDTV